MAEYYLFIKQTHLTTVTLSLLLFIIRGLGMLWDARWLQHKLVRILPHVIDSLLLISAICLTVILHQYPLQAHWLTAKVAGLLVYIAFGTIALKRGKTKTIRTLAFLLALTTFGYILAVAITRNPLPWN